MSLELDKLDANCSNCAFLERSISKRQKHVDLHYRLQKNYFDIKRIKLLEKGEWRLKRGEKEKAKQIFKEARKLVFVFDEGECSLHYGYCNKYKKEASFISNILQLETQECFKHRKEL